MDSSGASTLPLGSPSPQPGVRGATPASGTPPPTPGLRWPAGLAVRGQGRDSGNPLRALGQRARAKGLSKQRSHGAGGPATGVLSHPAAAAGRRFTGNRKMCTSHCWDRRRDLRRKGVRGGRGSPEGCLRRWVGAREESCGGHFALGHSPWSCLLWAGILPGTHTSAFLLYSCPPPPAFALGRPPPLPPH